jgi:hypothetical protein
VRLEPAEPGLDRDRAGAELRGASLLKTVTPGMAGGLLIVHTIGGCMGPGICTLSVEPGIAIQVRDRTTSGFLSTAPRGVVREGTFQDSLRVGGVTADVPPLVTMLIGADERGGRYTAHLEADGYQPWDTAGIRVTEGECHVRTVSFTAAMEPVP